MPGRNRTRPPLERNSIESQLDQAALTYLNRFEPTKKQLGIVLTRFVRRRCRPEDHEHGLEALARLLERYQGSGLLSDARYALNRVRSMRSKGYSRRRIEEALRARGVNHDLVLTAWAKAEEDEPGGDLAAARSYAKRRRLGPFRKSPEDQARYRSKDLAALGRAGFDFDVARRALASEEPGVF